MLLAAAAAATALWRLQNFLTSNKTLLYESPRDVTVVKQRSKRGENAKEKGEGEKPKAGGRALKPSHRLQVLPPLLSGDRSRAFNANANEDKGSLSFFFFFSPFRGKEGGREGETETETERGGGGSPNCLSTGSGRIF